MDDKDEIIEFEDFAKMFKETEDGQLELYGQKFTQLEFVQAKDFYTACLSFNIFKLPREEMSAFLTESAIGNNIGAKLMLCFVLDKNDLGLFMLQEDDKRLIGVLKRRNEIEGTNMDYDSPIIIARR